jgi:hypothetical protein
MIASHCRSFECFFLPPGRPRGFDTLIVPPLPTSGYDQSDLPHSERATPRPSTNKHLGGGIFGGSPNENGSVGDRCTRAQCSFLIESMVLPKTYNPFYEACLELSSNARLLSLLSRQENSSGMQQVGSSTSTNLWAKARWRDDAGAVRYGRRPGRRFLRQSQSSPS